MLCSAEIKIDIQVHGVRFALGIEILILVKNKFNSKDNEEILGGG